MTVKERIELQEAKLKMKKVGENLMYRSGESNIFINELIIKDICKVIHDIDKILDDDLYGRYKERTIYNDRSS